MAASASSHTRGARSRRPDFPFRTARPTSRPETSSRRYDGTFFSLSLSSSPRVGSLSSRSPSSRPFADAPTSPPPPSAFPVLDIPQEAEVFSTKDPAGFTLIDTMAWGSIGHVLGYAALAAKVSPPRPRESTPPPRPVRTRALTPSPLLAERQRLGRQCLATLVNKSLVHDTDDARRM